MNERIRALANKAGMVEVEYNPGFPDVRYPKNFEKFAELIVRECAAAIAADAKKFPPTDLTWIAAMEESARVVKAHFGVES